MNMKTRVGRTKSKKYADIAFYAVLTFIAVSLIYMWGYGEGQSDTYRKINDQIKVSQVKK